MITAAQNWEGRHGCHCEFAAILVEAPTTLGAGVFGWVSN
jgi:hypothetical protein